MPSATEGAVRRLEAALRSLETAVDERLSRSFGAEGLADEVQMLTADRSRLAEHLDEAQARAVKLGERQSRRVAAPGERGRDNPFRARRRRGRALSLWLR
jgi:hypothetical protein